MLLTNMAMKTREYGEQNVVLRKAWCRLGYLTDGARGRAGPGPKGKEAPSSLI
jgi:hypothetical protein